MKWKDICDCDVKDKERLALFRLKLKFWKNCLNGQDVYSITRQIDNLLWADTVYRTYNEAVTLSEETKDPSTGVPKTILGLFDFQFMQMQAVAIRRLTERSSYDPQRAVYSLRRIRNEIKDNIELYTRENYLCYDGITYEQSTNDDPQTEVYRDIRQRNFDILSKKVEENRTRNDKIENVKIFEDIEKDFDTVKTVTQYVNKYVVHASDPENRQNISKILDQISLKKFDDSYKAIFRIGKRIGLLIDEFFPCQVLKPQFDQLENWDKPIITPEDKNKLDDYWQKRVAQIESWDKKIHP